MFSRMSIVAMFLLLFASILCHAQTATCTNWTFFPGSQGQATAINRWGTVVGVTPKGVQQTLFGFIRWSNGGSTTYMSPNASGTSFNRRNALGVTVGFAYTAKGTEGLVRSGSSVVYLDYPGATDTELTGINYWGTIVGNSNANGAFKLKNGKFTSIMYPGAFQTFVNSISDKGVIVGTYDYHGFVLANGVYKTLDNPKATAAETHLTDINGYGAIVGFYYIGPIAYSFIYSNGVFKDINPPNGTYTLVEGINGYGYVTGTTNLPSGYVSFTAHCQ